MQMDHSATVKGKYILITGATSGIGKVAALDFAKKGAYVIIHGRDRLKAEATRDEIKNLSGNAQIDILLGDLTLGKDIRDMVAVYNQKYPCLDVLVNNAGGVMNKQRERTPDGWEKTIALNVLAPYLLTALLYPKLLKNPNGRVINTSSIAHKTAKADLDNFMYEKKYDDLGAYSDAKFYVLLLGQEFARRQARGAYGSVTMNAFHPGIVATNFAVESNSFYNFFFRFFRMFLISPQKGADTLIYLAEDSDVAKVSGGYFFKRKLVKTDYGSNAAAMAERLWALCAQYTGVSFLD